MTSKSQLRFIHIVPPTTILLVLIYTISVYYLKFFHKPEHAMQVVMLPVCGDSNEYSYLPNHRPDTLHMLTIIIGDSVVFYHYKTILPACYFADKRFKEIFGSNDLLFDLKSNEKIGNLIKSNHQKLIVFKFLDSAKYADMVFALDQCKRNIVRRYAILLDLDPQEKNLINIH